jgi:hypothetical protein
MFKSFPPLPALPPDHPSSGTGFESIRPSPWLSAGRPPLRASQWTLRAPWGLDLMAPVISVNMGPAQGIQMLNVEMRPGSQHHNLDAPWALNVEGRDDYAFVP